MCLHVPRNYGWLCPCVTTGMLHTSACTSVFPRLQRHGLSQLSTSQDPTKSGWMVKNCQRPLPAFYTRMFQKVACPSVKAGNASYFCMHICVPASATSRTVTVVYKPRPHKIRLAGEKLPAPFASFLHENVPKSSMPVGESWQCFILLHAHLCSRVCNVTDCHSCLQAKTPQNQAGW